MSGLAEKGKSGENVFSNGGSIVLVNEDWAFLFLYGFFMHKTGWIGNWSPGIGDPSLIAWITVVAYFIVAGLCFRNMRSPGQEDVADRKIRVLWLVLGVLLVFLGINKQLDLQTALTEFGRILSRQMGWYGQRRYVQGVFVSFVGATALGFVLWFLIRGRHLFERMFIPGLGMCVLLAFVLVRASSFHHIDQMLGLKIWGAKVNWVLEIGSLVIIAWGAVRFPVALSDRRG